MSPVNHIEYIRGQIYETRVEGGLGSAGFNTTDIYFPDEKLNISQHGSVYKNGVAHATLAGERAWGEVMKRVTKAQRRNFFSRCCPCISKKKLSDREINAMAWQAKLEADNNARKWVLVPKKDLDEVKRVYQETIGNEDAGLTEEFTENMKQVLERLKFFQNLIEDA